MELCPYDAPVICPVVINWQREDNSQMNEKLSNLITGGQQPCYIGKRRA